MTQIQMTPVPNTIKNDRLYIALELSNTKWKIAFGNGFKMRMKTIAARGLNQFEEEVEKAKKHFGMAQDVAICSCYEAGRDGFWIHRYLISEGIANMVVDSSSIEVNRRFRRVKTDRIDARKLLSMLIRYMGGESKLWSVLHIPTAQAEDDRRLNREVGRLKKERTAHTNRIKSLLALQGIVMVVDRALLKRLEAVRLWNGERVPAAVKEEIIREYERWGLIQEQLNVLEAKKKSLLEGDSPQAKKVAALKALKGIGPVGSWDLVFEYFGWRQFEKVKEVGAAAGLAPTPYDSGGSKIEQGISKCGNRRVRALMIELAWFWLRYQPYSPLSRWFWKKYGKGNKRMRRIGIVALARKLLVALWKYVEHGVVPEGAIFKTG
jgi:transposase